MITEKDMYFHTPTSDDHYWAETNYFGFYVPEVPLHVNVYVLARQNAGVVLSGITVTDGFSNTLTRSGIPTARFICPFPTPTLTTTSWATAWRSSAPGR